MMPHWMIVADVIVILMLGFVFSMWIDARRYDRPEDDP